MRNTTQYFFGIRHIQVAGVTLGDGAPSMLLLELRLQRGRLEVVRSVRPASVDELGEMLRKDLPLLLHLDGKGVLNRKVDFTDPEDVKWYENLDISVISYTCVKTDSGNFMSFCRNGLVDEVLGNVFGNTFSPSLLSLGVFPVSYLANPLGLQSIVVSGLELETDAAGNLTGFQRDDRFQARYDIGKQELDAEFLPLYAMGFCFFSNPENLEEMHLLQDNISNYVHEKAFNRLVAVILPAVFLLLLLSHFGTGYYQRENMELENQSVYAKTTYEHILELEKSRDEKLYLLRYSGLLSPRYLSSYTYELVTLPNNGLVFAKLSVFPMENQLKTNVRPVLSTNKILLSGNAATEIDFNNWMRLARQKKWVTGFEILRLRKNKDKVVEFEINITIGTL